MNVCEAFVVFWHNNTPYCKSYNCDPIFSKAASHLAKKGRLINPTSCCSCYAGCSPLQKAFAVWVQEDCKIQHLQNGISDKVTLTLSVGLHSRCGVDSISKQTVSGHFQADHAGADWTCKTHKINKVHLSAGKENTQIRHVGNVSHYLTISTRRMYLNKWWGSEGN